MRTALGFVSAALALAASPALDSASPRKTELAVNRAEKPVCTANGANLGNAAPAETAMASEWRSSSTMWASRPWERALPPAGEHALEPGGRIAGPAWVADSDLGPRTETGVTPEVRIINQAASPFDGFDDHSVYNKNGREHHALVYDAARDQLFYANMDDGLYPEVWRWDGVTWLRFRTSMRVNTLSPAMADDSARERGIARVFDSRRSKESGMLSTAGAQAVRTVVGVAIVAFVTAPWSAVPAQVTDCSGQIDGTPCDDGNVCTLSQSCMSGCCAPPPAQNALSGGNWNTCALRSSGRLGCWGDDGYHEVSGPNASADRFSAIACGSYHTCALRIDGRLACWGEPPIGYSYGQVSGPNADPDSYIAVSGGNYHTCALHTDGRLACWGYDTGGQVSGPNASADLYIAVSGGGAHTCALRTDGRIACWGYDSKGQVSGPNASPDIFTALSAGNEDTCAVRRDGRIACWGLDTLGQVSGPNAANEQYSSVSAGSYHTCAVRADGRLACWGHDNYGQASGPSASTENYTAVDVGPLRTCAIRANGRLVCWGYDLRGEVSGPNASEGFYGLNQLDCDDGNPCTDDSCDASSGCIHTPNTLPCDDGSACTRVDTCSDGACVGADPVVCTALDQCHVPGICDPETGVCSSPSQPDGTVCSDGNWCTGGDACQEGSCTPTFNGLDEPNPRSNAYYKRLCRGPHSGDQLTDADAWCVAWITTTFAGISTVAQICDVIEPSHPNSDRCGQTEDELIVLALNICRARVCVEQPIASRCGENGLVGESLAESDAILLSPSRNLETCSHAKCLGEEINSGSAILADPEPWSAPASMPSVSHCEAGGSQPVRASSRKS